MENGKIARIMDRGYGFISREGQDKDLFFHAKDVKEGQFNDMKEGDPVVFTVSEGPKGPCATEVAKA